MWLDRSYLCFLHTYCERSIIEHLNITIAGTAVNTFDPQDFPPFTFSSPQEPEMASSFPLEHSRHFSQAET